jgi:DNA-binding IclR family transcriptional regulator
MPTIEKTFGLLGLFTPETPVRSSEALIEFLGTPTSTGYRHIKTLQSTGFVTRVGGGSYMLGPRVLELDRTMRLSDPIYVAGGPVIAGLRRETGKSAVLSTLYSDSVVGVCRELAPDGPPDLFDRGQRRPLVAGASAKAILAYLPPHQLRRIFGKHAADIAGAGLGGSWDEFKRALRAIRQAGFVMTIAEYHPDIASIAAPIFNGQEEVLGSLMLAISLHHPTFTEFAALAPRVVEAAREISRQIALMGGAAALPARAVG